MFHVDLSQQERTEEAECSEGSLKCDFCVQPAERSTNLPCEHVLCKNCLRDCRTSSNDKIECPICLETSKSSVETGNDESQQEKEEQSDPTPVPMPRKARHVKLGTSNASSELVPGKSTRNPVQHINAVQDLGTTYGLSTKLKWDFEKSIYWGMGVCPSGDVILADWGNERVKVYNTREGYLSSMNVKQPLDVIYLGKGLVVVSHGGKAAAVTYIMLKEGILKNQRIVQANLYCFCMTMYTKKKVGIALAERGDGSPTLAVIKPTGKVKELDLGCARVALVSYGGILYHSKADRLYTTSGTKLMCINIEEGRIEFTQTYVKGSANSYSELGYLTCYSARSIFVASRRCVLCVTTTGELLSVIEALLDPYSIVITPDSNTIILGGRSSMLEVLDMNKDH